jgi:hypothetical protein
MYFNSFVLRSLTEVKIPLARTMEEWAFPGIVDTPGYAAMGGLA